MSPRVKGAILLTAAFLLGTVAGALSHAIFQSRWGAAAQEMRLASAGGGFLLRRLDRELNLTAAQREKIEQILLETVQERAKLRAELGPQFNELHARFRARIFDMLDPEQQRKFAALVARRTERLKREFGSPDAPALGPR